MKKEEREFIKLIFNQIKILEKEGFKEDIVPFINCILNNATKLKYSNTIIDILSILKDYFK